MSFCGNCGASVPAGAAFCGECGRSTTEPFRAPEVRAVPTDAATVAMPKIVPATPDSTPQIPEPTVATTASPSPVRPEKEGLPTSATILIGLLGLVAVGIGLYVITKDDDTSPNDAVATTVAGTGSTIFDAATTSIVVATSTPVDPAQVASDQLQAFVTQDRPTADTLVGLWVPQLSAKRVGLEADGIVYGPVEIVANHTPLRSTYGAILVDGGAFQFTSGGDPMTGWFLTIVPEAFATRDEAAQWCTDRNLGGNVCLAREFQPPTI